MPTDHVSAAPQSVHVSAAPQSAPCIDMSERSVSTLMHKDPSYIAKATRYEFLYASMGLVVGIICVVAGVVLFLHGIVGSTSWTAKVLGAESQLSDAAPGVVFGILGFFVVYVTRFKLRLR
jgi:hypothetical protein